MIEEEVQEGGRGGGSGAHVRSGAGVRAST